MSVARRFLYTAWAKVLIVGLVTVAAFLGMRLAFDMATEHQNRTHMADLTKQTLRRAELSADYVVITLGEAATAGLSRCDAASLMEIRRTMYLRGAIKDIQVLGAGGVVRCAAMPQAGSLGVANFDLGEGHVARNTSIVLHDIGIDKSGLMGIAWRFGSELTYLGVLNVDSMMFDVFPAILRDKAYAEMVLGDRTFASYMPEGGDATMIMDAIVFEATSERYPLTIRLTLSSAALSAWGREQEPFAMAAGLVLGLMFGVLIASVVTRPPDMRREMRAALRKGGFVPYMQPIFDIESRVIVGCEVLTRWVKPDGEIVQPARFIPQAEESGLIVPITRLILKASLEALGAQLKADKNFKIAFNIVPADLVSETFAEDICAIVRDAGASRHQIVLEITERQQFVDQAAAIAAVEVMQNLGFRVSLDDTGTGHNGLSYVQEFGADILKIDKHFVDLVGLDRAATKIIQMLVGLADDLGMATVAEGIETEEQLAALRECGVDQGQGYLISRPVPVGEFIALVDAQARVESDRAAA